jgi:uncharacterized protein YbjQ (UPF0145 family)
LAAGILFCISSKQAASTMIVSNLETLPGQHVVKHLGLAQGSTVKAKHVGKDFLAGLKNIVGGELKAYTELMQDAREEAVRRMVAEATSMGANAVLNVRFASTSITMGAAEILAYGSAVVVEPLPTAATAVTPQA